MTSIARTGASTPTEAATPKRSAPNLDAQVRTYRAQLADWITCPSAKTPQGKAKIEQISAKLDSVKQQIKKTDGSAPAESSMQQATPPDTPRAQADPDTYLGPSSQIGIHVDAYA
jgi:hypothetical protein